MVARDNNNSKNLNRSLEVGKNLLMKLKEDVEFFEKVKEELNK